MNHSATTNSLNQDSSLTKDNNSSNKIGICLLVTDIDLLTGGVQSISFRLLNEFSKRDYKTFVCCRNYHNLKRNEWRNGTLIHRSPTFSRYFVAFNSLSYLIDSLFWLIRYRKEYDIIHCQQIFAPAMLGLLARTILRKPVLVGVHSTGQFGEINDLRNTPLHYLRLRQLKTADGWTVLNQVMRKDLEELGIEPKKINFIPNSAKIPNEVAYIPEVKKAYRDKLNLGYKQIVVFTGRLSGEKGLDILMTAWSKICKHKPQAHLLILGEGGGFPDVESEIRNLCSKLNLNESVHFLGFKPNPTDYLLASDVFVLPSLSEGMSVALIEAMAAGLAIVATDIPANQYLCQDNINSLLVPPSDADYLAESINRILDDPILQKRLGLAAREKAEQDLSVEIMTDRYLSLYSKIIKKFRRLPV